MSKTTNLAQIVFKNNSSNDSTIVNDESPMVGGLSSINVYFYDNSVNNGIISSDVSILSSDYLNGADYGPLWPVYFMDNSINNGEVTKKMCYFTDNSVNSGHATYAWLAPLSASSTVTNDGVIDVAFIAQYPQSIVNNGTINYAKFSIGAENIANNGTINVSAYWWGHVWPNPADVTEISVTPFYPNSVSYGAFVDVSNNPIGYIYVSGGLTSVAEVVSAGAQFWINPQLSHDETHHPNQKRSGFVTEGSLLYYLSAAGGGHLHNGLSPANPFDWYVDGELSNLDSTGSSTFYTDNITIGGNPYISGTYTTWNGKFYQNGGLFTGAITYVTYGSNEYNVVVANGTADATFAEGVRIS